MGLQSFSSSVLADDRSSVAVVLLFVSWCRTVGRGPVLGEVRLEVEASLCAGEKRDFSRLMFWIPKTCQYP